MAPPLHYLLDTSAILRSPEILASARHYKILIPKAVFGELTTRGREHIRNVVGSLVSNALDAGAEVIESPTHLRSEPIASDRNAQRLGSADMEIARTAIGLFERSIPVCVVTLDGELVQFLDSRKIRAITPTEFMAQLESKPSDVKLLASARSLTSAQIRYTAISFGAGILSSIAASTIYSKADLLVSTISIWGTVVVLPTMGVLLFWYRQRFRLSYGVFEFLVGVMMALYVFLPSFDYKGLGLVQGIQVLGGLYVMVRGLDNVGIGIIGTRLESLWNTAFGRG